MLQNQFNTKSACVVGFLKLVITVQFLSFHENLFDKSDMVGKNILNSALAGQTNRATLESNITGILINLYTCLR